MLGFLKSAKKNSRILLWTRKRGRFFLTLRGLQKKSHRILGFQKNQRRDSKKLPGFPQKNVSDSTGFHVKKVSDSKLDSVRVWAYVRLRHQDQEILFCFLVFEFESFSITFFVAGVQVLCVREENQLFSEGKVSGLFYGHMTLTRN